MAAGTLAGAALAATTGCRRTPYAVLDGTEASTLAALCDQIIPADDFPSASQAGVLTFIDRQLSGPYRRHRRAYRDGLHHADQSSRTAYGLTMASCSAPQQVELVARLEKQNPAFFDLLRNHTMQGYYGSPRHGGNRDAASWRMLGLPEPPVRGRAQYDLTAGSKP